MNARDTLLLQYEGLSDGTSLAGELCPACDGGSTKEGSLSVSKREGLLLWQCHRASCGFAGAASSSGQTYQRTEEQAKDWGAIGRQVARECSMVATQYRELLASKYFITENHISKYGLGWDDRSQRLVLPVQDVRSERLGVVLRSLNGASPKTFKYTEEGALAWYINPATTSIIIVEDQLSAIRASDYLTSVALLGTHLNEARISEIRNRSGGGHVYLALDADAWSKAIDYTIAYRSRLKLQLLKLTKDIKNHDPEELAALLGSLA
jgi:hypothetical protein